MITRSLSECNREANLIEIGINIYIKAVFLRPSSVTRIQSKHLASFSSVAEWEGVRDKLLPQNSPFSVNKKTLKVFGLFVCFVLYSTSNEKLKPVCTSTGFLAFHGKNSKNKTRQNHFIPRNIWRLLFHSLLVDTYFHNAIVPSLE